MSGTGDHMAKLDKLAGDERLTSHDLADVLTSVEEISVFLDEVEKTDDPAYIARANEVAERTP
ncbi:hypothetical protein LYZ77_21485 [Xanthomonas hortorum pv. vitians]|uniref:hypothetical protein n=1 Tax=Xanthomonas hortorum TaxID=56454 RepID=UPI0012A91475|nr:hypothetical protein [Xanthomonas hortorum]MCE4282559.1 hypothetical protein [Xanthomonas hortorum pv. vitians]MCE4287412.1 hypothetical protein [Xanthomonas hortorum pv. vitians]MCE4291838.1 hypothetical protein [Xanthomonas hortorum pv. vitians]MCE4296137.1 hypothetical protein [Xanthomonas hortorum pv. vitians]MDT7854882.1 hypothetical protein [Xanthomonas hortorum pv. vitians]